MFGPFQWWKKQTQDKPGMGATVMACTRREKGRFFILAKM